MNEIIANKHIQAITNILKNIGERIEGNLICDIKPDNYIINRTFKKIKNIQTLAKGKKKIMEIGVNACHSLLLMVMINPTAEYLLFDLNLHKYTEPTINYVKEKFPNTKINIIYGNSVETINKFINDNPSELNTFDLVHLDGGHTEDIFSHDYNNSKKLLKNNGIVVFDDYNYPDIRYFINKKLIEKEIVQYRNTNIIPNNLHFIYQYN